MWTVLETKKARKNSEKLPHGIKAAYEAWKLIVRQGGPEALRAVKGYCDEALGGKRKGERSSRLSLGYRVIYKVKRGILTVEVLDANKHDYR